MGTQELSLEQKLSALAAVDELRGAPLRGRRLLAEIATEEFYQAGAVVFRAGEAADAVLVVTDGQLGVRSGGPNSDVHRILGPGSILGEYAMLSPGHLRTASVRAETNSRVLRIEHSRFESFLLTHPEVLWALFRTAIQRLIALESG